MVCSDRHSPVQVDYETNGLDDEEIEWRATLPVERQAAGVAVVRYGDPSYDSEVLLPPPDDWVTVSAYGLYAQRNELIEGEWVWFNSQPPFVPRMPCEGADPQDLST